MKVSGRRLHGRLPEERLAALRREEQELATLAVKDEQIAAIASQIEGFRARVSQGLAGATFFEKRALVELLIDRVIIDAPDVEIRYVVPLTGAAERKGVLRTRHRARGIARLNRGHAASLCTCGCSCLGGRPLRFGATHSGSGTW